MGSAYACLMRIIIAIELSLRLAVVNALIIVDGRNAVQWKRANDTAHQTKAGRWAGTSGSAQASRRAHPDART
jgi:hypothetical protein